MNIFRVAVVFCGLAAQASSASAQSQPFIHDDLSGTLKNQLIVKSEGSGADFTFDIDYEYKASLLMGEPVVTCSARVRNPAGHIRFEYDGQLHTVEIDDENAKLLTPYNIDLAITYKSIHSDNAYFLARCNTGIPGSWAQQALNVPFSPDWDDFLCWAAGSRFTTPASTPNILGDDWCKTLGQGGGKLRDEEETRKRFAVTAASDGGPVTRAIEVDIASFAINYNDLIFAEIKKLSAQKIAQRKFNQARQIRNSLHHSGAASTEAAQLLDHAESEAAMLSDPREQARILQGAMRDVLDIRPTQEDAKLFTGTRALIVSLLSSDEERSFIAGIKDDLAGIQDVIDRSTSNVNAFFDQQRTAAASAPQFAFSDPETTVAAATGPGDIKNELVRIEAHNGIVLGIAFHPDGKRLASAGIDGMVSLWDVNTGKKVFDFADSSSGITVIAISPDGKHLVGGGGKGSAAVTVWNIETGEKLWQSHIASNNVQSISVSPDSKLVLSGEVFGPIVLWSLESGAHIRTLAEKETYPLSTFSLDGRFAIYRRQGTNINWYDLESGTYTVRAAIGTGTHKLIPVIKAGIMQFGAWSHIPNSDATVLTMNGNTIYALHPNGSNEGFGVMADIIPDFAISPDGDFILYGDLEGNVRLTETSEDKKTHTLGRHDEQTTERMGEYCRPSSCNFRQAVFSVAFSPDGSRAASAGADGTIRIWGP